MKRDLPDFFTVEPHQLAIHERLLNWAQWVTPRLSSKQAGIWRLGRSNARQWHEPELRPPVNELDAAALEISVCGLPEVHRFAIRWCYVWKTGPSKARRAIGVTDDGLRQAIRDGRQMLLNRPNA